MDQGSIILVAITLFLAATVVVIFLRWRRQGTASPLDEAALAAPSPSTTSTVPAEPIAVEEVVPGKLRVRVFYHVIRTEAGPVPCWTYVSDGLLAEGQEEIAFSVKRELSEPESAFPRELLGLYAIIQRYAVNKQLVHEGGTTRFGRSGPGCLRDDLRGILYTPGQQLEGVRAPGPFLTALILTSPEIDVAQQFGEVRLMSLLGKRYRFFPTAPWLDRHRTEIARPEAMVSSILARAQRYRLPGASVRYEAAPGAPATIRELGTKVVLTVTRAAGRRFVEDLRMLRPEIGLAVMVDVDPEADAIFSWEPGQTTPEAILMPRATGQRIAGNFLLIASVSDEDGAKVVEDGFGLLLTKQTWDKVRSALEEGQPIEFPGSRNLMGFALAWAEESFTNPIDGRCYTGRWLRYRSSFGASEAPSASVHADEVVKLADVRLLQPEAEIHGRIEPRVLAEYTMQTSQAVASTVGGNASGPGFDLMVQFELSPARQVSIQISRPGSALPADTIRELDRRLRGVPVPEIRDGSVRFLLRYIVRGGQGVHAVTRRMRVP